MRVSSFQLRRTLRAGLLAAGVLWVVAVTAGSDTAVSAFSAIRASLPLEVLRWELGDLWTEDSLSPAVVMTIGESPLLLAARPAVAELWQEAEAPEAPPEAETETEEEDEIIEDEDVDKRKLLREADAIAMKPASDFEGGEEEKFRTLTKKLESLGYNRSSRGTANDAKARVLDSKTKRYLDARIKDAANLGMKLAVKRFHDVLPFIADGTIPFEDIKPGMTPCEIKQKFVEERTGRRFTDAKRLNVAFDLATRAQFNDGWNRQESFHADVLDEKAEAIAAIGTHRKGAK